MCELLHIKSSILGTASLGLNDGIHLSEHGIVKGMEVLWRDMVPDLSFQTFATSFEQTNFIWPPFVKD